jgi:hypothetical protein
MDRVRRSGQETSVLNGALHTREPIRGANASGGTEVAIAITASRALGPWVSRRRGN